MYKFVDLTDDQKHQRRYLLDWYAALAQISVLVPLAIVLLFRFASWLAERWLQRSGKHDSSGTSSPYIKERHNASRWSLRGAQRLWRSLMWSSGDSVEVYGVYFGTTGELIFALIWTGWLVLLSFLQTGDDYMHVTKRFGIVGASQLPVHYLLSLKSPYSPIQYLTGRSHESLISLHQLLGRLIVFLFYLHAVLYAYFFIVKDLMLLKLTQLYIICGVVAVIAFTILGTTALAPIRKRNYRLFYISHVSIATAVLPILYFHVHHIRIYIWETLAVYLLATILRAISTTSVQATITRIPSTNLLSLTIPLSTTSSRLPSYSPAQHAYISLLSTPYLRTFHSNPFTLSSLPTTDHQLRFIARILDGATAKLASHASAHKTTPHTTVPISLEGPYGLSTHPDRFLRYDRVLFVAGGVGATFIVPLYRQLLADLSPGAGSWRRSKVGLVWVVKSLAETKWAVPEGAEGTGFVERAGVWVTGVGAEGEVEGRSGEGKFVLGEDEEDEGSGGLAGGRDSEGIELEERKVLLEKETGAERGGEGESGTGLKVFNGRPDLGRVVDQVFSQSSTERVAVVVCGPRSLSWSLRKEVDRWVRNGRDVWFWDESFGL